MRSNPLRAIPSVDKVVRELGQTDLPRAALVAIVRAELAQIRHDRNGFGPEAAVEHIRKVVDDLRRARIQPVINGTGIIIHTNLGRSPLGPAVVRTLTDIASNYNNLEYDLTQGERGGRAAYLEHNLAVLCGVTGATVVNNCAAALVLILRHFTAGERKEVVISRGELVQIGGGFRIPEILEASGATLREVGTTNKTSLADYSRAISRKTALILKVHRSNFFMGGFVDSPRTEELSEIARRKRVQFVEDLGSGAVSPTELASGVEHEPTPAEVLAKGVGVVCFSGDKLFGGPQAGIIAGTSRQVAALKRDPFFRALRCDKLILAALQATVDLHLRSAQGGASAPGELPVIDMLREPKDALLRRAEAIAAALRDVPASVEAGTGKSQVGGGTLPRASIDSVTVDVRPAKFGVSEVAARLRAGSPPVIGFVSGGRLKFDLRTVFPRQDADLVAALRSACVPRPEWG